MQKFTVLRAIAAPYLAPNVDTDTIIRVERCARTPKAELGRWAFEMLRYRPDGSENPDFALNQEPFRGAQILVAGENFGCGSSREMAVWALAGMGLRCVIAPSFGEIFLGNCFQNGVLALRLPRETVERLGGALAARPDHAALSVDLERQTVEAPDGELLNFDLDPLYRKALLEGLDAIGVTLAREPDILAWRVRDRSRRPWVYV